MSGAYTRAWVARALFVGAGLASAGCAGAAALVDGGALDATGSGDVVVGAPEAALLDVGAEVLPERCVPRAGEPVAEHARCVREIRGRVTDLDGAPVPAIAITLCGPVCFFAETDAQGAYRLTPNALLDPSIYSLIFHARPAHASLYVPSPARWPEGDVVVYGQPERLPRYTVEGDAVPDGATGGVARAGPLTLTVPVGTELMLDVEDAAIGPLGRRLRLAPVPLDRAPAFVHEGRVELLYALAPFNLVSSRPLGVRLENALRWPAGAEVELISLGNRLLELPIDAGRPLVAARARVSADGAFIETAAGEGLRVVNWLGLRRVAR